MVETSQVFYDSNIFPHHNFFDTDTGELKGVEAGQFEILGVPEPPPGKIVAGRGSVEVDRLMYCCRCSSGGRATDS